METLLGKKVEYPQHYQPEILRVVERKLNREQYGIDENELPFVGYDAWHAYEVSYLLTTGLPVVKLAKIVYLAETKYIIESKSLKLYLNSFNMEPMGRTEAEATEAVRKRIAADLTAAVESRVDVCLFDMKTSPRPENFDEFEVLEDMPEMADIQIENYTEEPSLLSSVASGGTIRVCSHLLRSNCKITHQPDWGSVFIHLTANDLPTYESLLKYIVSARGENHFHEEICEMIFKRLYDRFRPQELMVTCVYTRRGGIDICPVRATKLRHLPKRLIDFNTLTNKLLRQ